MPTDGFELPGRVIPADACHCEVSSWLWAAIPPPVPGMTAVKRNPAVRAATSAFPRFRQLHP